MPVSKVISKLFWAFSGNQKRHEKKSFKSPSLEVPVIFKINEPLGLVTWVVIGNLDKNNVNMVKIFVGNVHDSSRGDDLRELFQKYGRVTESDVVDGKGFGFVVRLLTLTERRKRKAVWAVALLLIRTNERMKKMSFLLSVAKN